MLGGAVGININERFRYSDSIQVCGTDEIHKAFWTERRDYDFDSDDVSRDLSEKNHNSSSSNIKKDYSHNFHFGAGYKVDLKKNSPEVFWNVSNLDSRVVSTFRLANSTFVFSNSNLVIRPYFYYICRTGMGSNPVFALRVSGKIIHPIYFDCYYRRGNSQFLSISPALCYDEMFKSKHEGWVRFTVPLIDNYGKFSIQFGFKDLYTNDFIMQPNGEMKRFEYKNVSVPFKFTYSHCFSY